jgi:pimeloyl-ACP methyl ester carboxylesterase
MALIARTLAKSGFQVITYDAPAHTSLPGSDRSNLSNFFEFSRAVAQVSKNLGPFHAIVGHSLGAISTVFAITGKSLATGSHVETYKLILMGLPVYLEDVVASFCRNHGLNSNECLQLKVDLELSFNFSFADFSIIQTLDEINAEILLIHDRDDEEFTVDNTQKLKEKYPEINIMITRGTGHQKMVMNRQVIAGIKDYLMK